MADWQQPAGQLGRGKRRDTYELKCAQCPQVMIFFFSRSSPPLTSSRCDFHLVIFIYTKWNCEISATTSRCSTMYYPSRKKVAHLFPPPSCPAGCCCRSARLPWAAAPKNRLCVAHNSPLARPLDINAL